MRILIIVLSLLIATTCFAEVKLFRYVDKATGEEKGICYSDKDGNPRDNPDWEVFEIPEGSEQKYIKLQNKQLKDKHDAEITAYKEKTKRVKTKLKDLGISQDDLDAVIE